MIKKGCAAHKTVYYLFCGQTQHASEGIKMSMTELDKQIAHAADQYNEELMFCRDEDAAAWLRVMYELIDLRNNQAA